MSQMLYFTELVILQVLQVLKAYVEHRGVKKQQNSEVIDSATNKLNKRKNEICHYVIIILVVCYSL